MENRNVVVIWNRDVVLRWGNGLVGTRSGICGRINSIPPSLPVSGVRFVDEVLQNDWNVNQTHLENDSSRHGISDLDSSVRVPNESRFCLNLFHLIGMRLEFRRPLAVGVGINGADKGYGRGASLMENRNVVVIWNRDVVLKWSNGLVRTRSGICGRINSVPPSLQVSGVNVAEVDRPAMVFATRLHGVAIS
ncbi:hypothetical protein NE237_025920 [Protea cynaroides]|uniref:Uncharacterized protein n=1 Tax=Protea cynaroides TaxID=273540 RepID=A0A9Q0H7Y3_9MAGN|nr:hypothetical protein NE237_025920 [Protea cynaroides]